MIVVLSAAAPMEGAPRPAETPSDKTEATPAAHNGDAAVPLFTGPGTATQPDEATLREILEIRREQGGVLEGTLLDELSRSATGDRADTTATDRWQEEEFTRALRGVATAASQAGTQASPQPPVPQSEIPRLEVSGIEPSPATLSPGAPANSPSVPALGTLGSDEPVDDANWCGPCGYASRQLDRKANDLEDGQRYSDADQLRVLSERLRQESRRWGSTPTLTRESAAPEVPLAPIPVE